MMASFSSLRRVGVGDEGRVLVGVWSQFQGWVGMWMEEGARLRQSLKGVASNGLISGGVIGCSLARPWSPMAQLHLQLHLPLLIHVAKDPLC